MSLLLSYFLKETIFSVSDLCSILEKLSSLNFVFNYDELVITMVLTRAKSGLYFRVQFLHLLSS